MGDSSIPIDVLDGVEEVLDEVGALCQLRVTSGGTIDVNNPGAGSSPETTIDYPFDGLFYNYEDKHIDGTVVKVGDRRVIASIKDLPITPAPGMLVVRGGSSYSIVDVDLPEVSGVAVVGIFQIRG